MSFINNKPHKQYSIALKTANDNTVGFINLTSQFLKAVTGKQAEYITTADIEAINKGDLKAYIATLDIVISSVETTEPIASIEDF